MDKKIGIINHWMVNNYGALLLAYALERKLTELGYNAETISWLPDEVRYPWKLSMIKKIGIVQYILRLGYFSVFILPRQKSFAHFRSMMHTSQRQYNDSTLPNISHEYEKIVIGGDQLWNCKINYFNVNNFLPFIEEKSRKVVYAASLAQDQMRKGFEEEFRHLANGFGYITTREKRASEIIFEITHRNVPQVVDPAFLLTAKEWSDLEDQDEKLTGEKFVFVYQVQSDDIVTKFAQKIAKEKRLKIVYCPFPLKSQISCKRKPYISPERWIWYVRNAEYVFTDAFHGLVFAIIFNKQFAVEISEYGKDTHSRITNLLESLGLEKRLFSETVHPDMDHIIDYANINSKIDKRREEAIKHIHAMLNL